MDHFRRDNGIHVSRSAVWSRVGAPRFAIGVGSESRERALDAGTGGLRKIRMAIPGSTRGKSAGVRVHCLWLEHLNRIYLLFVYGKDEQDSLSSEQKKALKKIVQQIKET
jgi:hypothetical protein